MALENILTTDGDIKEAKTTLTRTLHILSGAGMEYAKAALGAANAVLEVAIDGGPCAAAYTQYAEIGKFETLTRNTVDNMIDLTTILLALNESEDDSVNEAYATHLREMSRIGEITALNEGAINRLQTINRALPKDPQPAARFDPSVFVTEGS